MYHIFFIHSFIDGCLGWLHNLVILNAVLISINMQVLCGKGGGKMFTCMCIDGGQGLKSNVFFYQSWQYFWDRFFTISEVAILARLVGQQASRILCLCLPALELIIDVCCHAKLWSTSLCSKDLIHLAVHQLILPFMYLYYTLALIFLGYIREDWCS